MAPAPPPSPPPPPIPAINLAASDTATVDALRRACTESGVFLLDAETHGVPPAVIDDMFDAARALFALPLADKMALLKGEDNRGYSPMHFEKLDLAVQRKGDTKEGYNIGREVPHSSPEAALPLHAPNVWPREDLVPGFRAAADAYFAAASALGQRLVRLLAVSLGLPSDHFDSSFDPPMAFLRPLRYSPELSRPDDGVLGAGAHTDYGMLTILATDGTPGLQVHLDGAWVDVHVPRHAFVCNLGDMLERWTNGRYKSTLHRVVSTAGRERFSLPFFFDPGFNAVVECLPCCVGPDTPPRYPPTTAGRHLLDKYAATHAGYGGQHEAGSGGDARAGTGSGKATSGDCGRRPGRAAAAQGC